MNLEMASQVEGERQPDDSMFRTIWDSMEPKRKLLTTVSCNMVDHLETIIEEKMYDLDAPLQEQNGNRALHIACKEGNHACVRKLLEAGATVDMGNDYGFTPMAMALRYNRVECARLLFTSGSPLSDPHIVWLSQKVDNMFTWFSYKQEMISMLLVATPDFCEAGGNIVKEMYNKFLRKSCDEGHAEVIKVYLMTGNGLTDEQHAAVLSEAKPELAEWLKNFQGAKSLQHCCRLAVRKKLKPNVFSGATKLKLPPKLQEYILYDDLNAYY